MIKEGRARAADIALGAASYVARAKLYRHELRLLHADEVRGL